MKTKTIVLILLIAGILILTGCTQPIGKVTGTSGSSQSSQSIICRISGVSGNYVGENFSETVYSNQVTLAPANVSIKCSANAKPIKPTSCNNGNCSFNCKYSSPGVQTQSATIKNGSQTITCASQQIIVPSNQGCEVSVSNAVLGSSPELTAVTYWGFSRLPSTARVKCGNVTINSAKCNNAKICWFSCPANAFPKAGIYTISATLSGVQCSADQTIIKNNESDSSCSIFTTLADKPPFNSLYKESPFSITFSNFDNSIPKPSTASFTCEDGATPKNVPCGIESSRYPNKYDGLCYSTCTYTTPGIKTPRASVNNIQCAFEQANISSDISCDISLNNINLGVEAGQPLNGTIYFNGLSPPINATIKCKTNGSSQQLQSCNVDNKTCEFTCDGSNYFTKGIQTISATVNGKACAWSQINVIESSTSATQYSLVAVNSPDSICSNPIIDPSKSIYSAGEGITLTAENSCTSSNGTSSFQNWSILTGQQIQGPSGIVTSDNSSKCVLSNTTNGQTTLTTNGNCYVRANYSTTSSCTPNCGSKVCGPVPNGCGTSCGNCPNGQTCTNGQCTTACIPDCTGRTCGTEPTCGTSCGNCPNGQTCTNGTCTTTCTNDSGCGPTTINTSKCNETNKQTCQKPENCYKWGSIVACNDSNPCTTDNCIGAGQCTFQNIANNTNCTTTGGQNGTCQNGTCNATNQTYTLTLQPNSGTIEAQTTSTTYTASQNFEIIVNRNEEVRIWSLNNNFDYWTVDGGCPIRMPDSINYTGERIITITNNCSVRAYYKSGN